MTTEESSEKSSNAAFTGFVSLGPNGAKLTYLTTTNVVVDVVHNLYTLDRFSLHLHLYGACMRVYMLAFNCNVLVSH